MRKDGRKIPLVPILAGVAVLTLVGVLMNLLGKPPKEAAPDQDLEAGIAYLEEREAKSPSDVIQARKQIEQQKINAHRDALVAELTSGDQDPFAMFKDYVVLGDSRAVGFWYHKFLDKSRVIADGGHTIRNLKEEIDKIVEINPSTIYLCYGLNDISIGYWDTKEEYVAEYMDTVAEIQARLPDATIVVSSILPASEQAFAPGVKSSARWRNIPEWSKALGEACRENGILFAECDSLYTKYPNLWDPKDGVHFRKELYPYWASMLVVTTLMEEGA